MKRLKHLDEILQQVQTVSPLVHCISNQVASNDCANIVLACGASPIMAEDPEEVAEVTAISRAVSLSLGTPNPRKAEALRRAGKQANALGIPVVFDPVGIGVSAFRQEIAAAFLEEVRPTVLRCNCSELRALILEEENARGVDADTAQEREEDQNIALAKAAARSLGCVVAMTGEEDVITDGTTVCIGHNGTPRMRSVTGTGCMLSVLTGAFVGADPEHPLEAALGAVCAMGLCGEIAEGRMQPQDGTGSFRVYLMDAVSNLTPEALEEGADYEYYR